MGTNSVGAEYHREGEFINSKGVTLCWFGSLKKSLIPQTARAVALSCSMKSAAGYLKAWTKHSHYWRCERERKVSSTIPMNPQTFHRFLKTLIHTHPPFTHTCVLLLPCWTPINPINRPRLLCFLLPLIFFSLFGLLLHSEAYVSVCV